MDVLFQNKKKNSIALCFSVLNAALIIIYAVFNYFRYTKNLRVAVASSLMSVIMPVALIVLLLTYGKEYKLKKWLLPIAFAVGIIKRIPSLKSNLYNFKYFTSDPTYILLLLCSALMLAALIFMLLGSLFELKLFNLLKYGALGHIILSVIMPLISFFANGGFEYFNEVPDGYAAISVLPLALGISTILFFAGIFILTTNKRND